MKRSQINAYIHDFIDFLADRRFHLPKWAFYSPQQWAEVGSEADEIRRCRLGWDVTDFGSNDFLKTGLTLFTLRNGVPSAGADPSAKDYCEKIMLVRENQVTPYHFHHFKMEDIINRGGGNLVIQLFNRTGDEQLDKGTEVTVQVDGITRQLPAGGLLVLSPGESVTLLQHHYHQFWAEAGHGWALVGEVSRVNDDATDNRFLAALPRFPAIEEDQAKQYLLCTEYPAGPGQR